MGLKRRQRRLWPPNKRGSVKRAMAHAGSPQPHMARTAQAVHCAFCGRQPGPHVPSGVAGMTGTGPGSANRSRRPGVVPFGSAGPDFHRPVFAARG